MDIKSFPEIGGEDGIWLEYMEGVPAPPMELPIMAMPLAPATLEQPPVLLPVPTWSELFMLVKLRISVDYKTLANWVKTKWSDIWHT